MIDLGVVRPGSTIRIPFSTFDKDDGSSITMTNYAAADILVYKNGSTTERASTAGFTATTDFDAKTGKHLAIIDLADNTTADFWNAGAEYLVAIDAVTVDAITTGGWIARFRIGYPDALFDTTIATLASQTSFTLTAGPAEDDALNGCTVIIHDIASAVQCGIGVIQDYTGASKTVTLAAGTTFTVAAGDNISILRPHPLQAAAEKILAAGRTLVVDANGLADANAVKVGPTGSGTAQTAGDIVGKIGANSDAATDPSAASGTVFSKLRGAGNDHDNIEADTQDIQGRLPGTLTADGNIKADTLRVGGTLQTAGDIPARLPAALTANGNIKASFVELITTALTEGAAGRLKAAFTTFFNVAAPVLTTASVDQTGDSFARIGANGGSLTALATQASVDTIDDFLDTEIAAILAAVDTEVASILSAVDTEVAAIKAKTDQLTFTVANQIDANPLSINGSATAAARLAIASANMLPGTVDATAFTPTTTQFEADDITEATADHFNGRIIVFTSGALQYQATTIADYALSGGRGHFTVTALTEAPSDNGTFIII